MCATYTENFAGEDYQIESARDGQEALSVMEGSGHPFDVVVTDNHMPNMDGIELLRKIRKKYPEVQVIVVTGYGDWTGHISDSGKNLKLLDKPVKMSELKRLIRELVPG